MTKPHYSGILNKTIVNQYLQSYNNTNPSMRTGFAQWIDHLIIAKRTWQSSCQADDYLYLKILCVKCRHQKHMQWIHVVSTVSALDAASLFDFTKTYKNFDDLYCHVSKAIGNITFARGILTRFDISLNIGILLNKPVYPDYVYLANHTRKSAQALNVYKYPRVTLKTFPKAFQKLSCMQLEDVLCVYYKVFLGINNNVTSITNKSYVFKLNSKNNLLCLFRKAMTLMNQAMNKIP